MWETVRAFNERVKGYRTLIFNSLYGVPMAVLALLDITHEIDITPILERLGVQAADVPLYLSCIAAANFILRWLTTTRLGCSHTAPDEVR